MTSPIAASLQHAHKQLDEFIQSRDATLREHNLDYTIVHKAWFAMAHLLLNDGAHVVHMGCQDGATTFAMAVLHPNLRFTGLDKNKDKIKKANQLYDLDNLDFKIGDATSSLFPANSLDAIIDFNFLHVVYSRSEYSELAVMDTLEQHHKMLKHEGQIFLRDFVCPPRDEFVLMELPDQPSTSDDIADLSDADLLILYSEQAGANSDLGYGGFFLEEIPPHFPNTRLFRLQHKWAYEFIMRKDRRDTWDHELTVEYAFYTAQELRNNLRRLGMRIPYASPYIDENFVRDHCEGHFRLYRDDGLPLDYPPLSYTTLGIKIDERESMQIAERRPAHSQDNFALSIQTLQNDHTGQLVDVVKRDFAIAEILPYRIDGQGRLRIQLHHDLIRSLANAIPRTGQNIDEHRYSGHMIEPLTVDQNTIPDADDAKALDAFTQDHLNVTARPDATLEKGPHYYPAPNFIDERIQCYFLHVKPPKSSIVTPIKQFLSRYKYTSKGDLVEYDAQQILDAISVGMIPNARLELEILALYDHLKLKPENWTQTQVNFTKSKLIKNAVSNDKKGLLEADEHTFSNAKDAAHNLRPVRSIFVEEGQKRGTFTGLSFQDVDFVIHSEQTENIAVILPLTKDAKNEVMAGVVVETMPIPQRLEGKGTMITAPQYPLPSDVTNLRLAKKYLAEKLSVLPENVIKMGEPYFTHIGVTPQKIHPFAVIVPPSAMSAPDTHFVPMHQLVASRLSHGLGQDKSFPLMAVLARSYRQFSDHIKMEATISAAFMAQKEIDKKDPSFSLPTSYYRAPGLPDYTQHIAPTIISDTHYNNRPLLGHDTEKRSKIVLKETQAPSFAPSTSLADKAVQAVSNVADQVKDIIQKPFLKKPDPDRTPDLFNAFEQRIGKSVPKTYDNNAAPKPEKW